MPVPDVTAAPPALPSVAGLNLGPSGAIGLASGVQAARLLLIVVASFLAALLGFHGWYIGLFVNILCCIFAVVLVSHFRLWRRIGLLMLSAGGVAALGILVLSFEILPWLIPNGLHHDAPGYILWAITMLLVGFNEELVSRGVVLSILEGSFSSLPTIAITAALFGLQHLSLLITTGRGAGDILLNVLAAACQGFALAAFQHRFHWILPLVLFHALWDFTTQLSHQGLGVGYGVISSVIFVVFGLVVTFVLPRKTVSHAS